MDPKRPKFDSRHINLKNRVPLETDHLGPELKLKYEPNLHGRSNKPARFYRLTARPPMLRSTWSSPSNAEDKRIRVHLCYSLPGATIIISIGGHATNFVQVLLHLRALEGMLHCSYKLLFVVAHKSLENFL